MTPIKTIFFGTPEFAATALKTLVENPFFEVIGVVTQPDRPTGRKKILTAPPVKVLAQEKNIKVFQPEKLRDEAINEIANLKAQLAVVVAYGNIIPKKLLDLIPMGFVNIHPSLLPNHRGASPLTETILAGDKETGVCLMVLDEQMDHGPIIACRRVALNGDETTSSLRQIVTPIASEMINKELVEYLSGKVVSVPQDHLRATFCKQIESAAARINWNKPAVEVNRLVRAMHGVTPAWTTLDETMLLIHSSSIELTNGNKPAGTIVSINKSPAIVCSEGCLILNEIQLAGGKAMSGQAFLNGHKDLIGKKLI